MKQRIHSQPSGFPAGVLLIGLAAAQAVATLQLWQSNQLLLAKMQAVIKAGFLAVPNVQVLPSLETPSAALCGGLFFTLSLGAAVSLGSLALAWLLPRDAGAGRLRRCIPLILWVLVLALVNVDGFDLYVSLYFIIIPPLVFLAGRRRLPKTAGGLGGSLHLLPVIVLALLWFSQFDADLFIDIRDRLLLSNPVGQRINHFYYRYTLYPAEAFKSLSQRMIRTAGIDLISDPSRRRAVAEVLTGRDWLPIADRGLTELGISQDGQWLLLMHENRVYVKIPMAEWSSRPGAVLQDFSQKTDRHAVFRQLSYYGLLLGFPILLYIGLHTVLRRLFGLLSSPAAAAFAASAACLVAGVAVWVFFQHGRTEALPPGGVRQALASERWQTQVAALRRCREKEIDVRAQPAYAKLKSSRNIAVRYWLVETLAAADLPDTGRELMEFLDDPSINVRTRACAVLAQRGERQAVAILIDRLKTSDEWYFQWYAYKALKALGWKQPL